MCEPPNNHTPHVFRIRYVSTTRLYMSQMPMYVAYAIIFIYFIPDPSLTNLCSPLLNGLIWGIIIIAGGHEWHDVCYLTGQLEHYDHERHGHAAEPDSQYTYMRTYSRDAKYSYIYLSVSLFLNPLRSSKPRSHGVQAPWNTLKTAWALPLWPSSCHNLGDLRRVVPQQWWAEVPAWLPAQALTADWRLRLLVIDHLLAPQSAVEPVSHPSSRGLRALAVASRGTEQRKQDLLHPHRFA